MNEIKSISKQIEKKIKKEKIDSEYHWLVGLLVKKIKEYEKK